eukprot:TRINITY_DN4104_c0_g1_i1.p1 TRINITY_DN4104_c0_g1~~TRINITY_DN4104_c0_g1_i1.p1  ORF type:complete len:255 (-),score=34.64 TRINITY_DN4104_c0_g1_i1:53-817(-)
MGNRTSYENRTKIICEEISDLDDGNDITVRIGMIGLQSSGKSCGGNTILNVATESLSWNTFITGRSGKRCTKKIALREIREEHNTPVRVQLIDTPGVDDIEHLKILQSWILQYGIPNGTTYEEINDALIYGDEEPEFLDEKYICDFCILFIDGYQLCEKGNGVLASELNNYLRVEWGFDDLTYVIVTKWDEMGWFQKRSYVKNALTSIFPENRILVIENYFGVSSSRKASTDYRIMRMLAEMYYTISSSLVQDI